MLEGRVRGRERWTELETPFRGTRRYFVEKATGRLAAADESGRWPEDTDDGVLWVDVEKLKGLNIDLAIWALSIEAWSTHAFMVVPVVCDDGSHSRMPCRKDELHWVCDYLNLTIKNP